MRIESGLRTPSSSEETLSTRLPTVIREPPSSDTDHDRETKILFMPSHSVRTLRNRRGNNKEMPASREQKSIETRVDKSRQKKFHRQFKELFDDEQLIDYYSCALITDILLQGHLYVTSNHFAFHSNVFGFMTKLLIPTSSVSSITKVKTAYIIPNAVAVCTKDRKHIFGTLLSRDATYQLMVQVWRSSRTSLCTDQSSFHHDQDMVKEDSHARSNGYNLNARGNDDDYEESSHSGSCSSSNIDLACDQKSEQLRNNTKRQGSIAPSVSTVQKVDNSQQTVELNTALQIVPSFRNLCSSDVILLASTILLAILFVSAGILLHRINILQQKYSKAQEPSLNTSWTSNKSWQLRIADVRQSEIELHTDPARSLCELSEQISSNMQQISKMRQSVQALSSLVEETAAEIREKSESKSVNLKNEIQDLDRKFVN